MIPAGLVLAATGYLLLAPILHDGGKGGVTMELDLLLVGLALGLAFSPMINVALRHVPIADAADASGVLVTVFQLGQVVGVSTLGTLYLSSVHGVGALPSAHALTTTLIVLAGSATLAAGFAAVLVRTKAGGLETP
jgi:hypothetical protein